MIILTHAAERLTLSTLTVDDALNLLQIAVDERGEEYVYRADERDLNGNVSCDYAESDGSPSCLIGLALSVIGVDPTWLSVGEDLGWAGCGIEVLGDDLGLPRKVSDVFSAAQIAQDTGSTWGTALEKARTRATDFQR